MLLGWLVSASLTSTAALAAPPQSPEKQNDSVPAIVPAETTPGKTPEGARSRMSENYEISSASLNWTIGASPSFWPPSLPSQERAVWPGLAMTRLLMI